MAWFRMDASFRSHRKVSRVARALGVSRIEAKGYLVTFLCTICDETGDGCIDGWQDLEIAEAADWEGEPKAFADALRAAGWLTEGDAGTEVYGYYERAGSHKSAGRQRKYRTNKKAKEALRNGDVTPPGASRDALRNGYVMHNDPAEKTLRGQTDRQTDGQTDRQTHLPPQNSKQQADRISRHGASAESYPDGKVIHYQQLDAWGHNSGYGAMGGQLVRLQKLGPFTRDELEFADRETRANARGGLRWSYLVSCIESYRKRLRTNSDASGGDPRIGHHRGSDFDENEPNGIRCLAGDDLFGDNESEENGQRNQSDNQQAEGNAAHTGTTGEMGRRRERVSAEPPF